MIKCVTVRVPATTANIGPGFDCLGLALDLWNESRFSLEGEGLEIFVSGEGEKQLPLDETNLIYQTFSQVFAIVGKTVPPGLRIACDNKIPLCSGLGSSSAATLTGVLGANALLGNPLNDEAIIRLCAQVEGHPDNVAPAYYGGLTVSIQDVGEVITRKITIQEWKLVILLPRVELSTSESRSALPQMVSIQDAVFNIGRTALVIQALSNGDRSLLLECMQDRLHQPYRLPLISSAAASIQAANDFGTPAALSGAGPSIIAFSQNPKPVAELMQAVFKAQNIETRLFALCTSLRGAYISIN